MALNCAHFTKTTHQIPVSVLDKSTTSTTDISTGISISISTSASTSACPGDSETILGTDLSILTRFHAGYFRISLGLCSQALLWKTLSEPTTDARALGAIVRTLPSFAFILLWSIALLTLVLLCILYAVRCVLRFKNVRAELAHHVGMNYLFAPWISFLLLLQSTPFIRPSSQLYRILWCTFSVPIVALDVKIYGHWFTQGKRFLSMVANPTSQITVIGNLVGARAVAQMGWRESAVCMFSLGIAHYLVLFVTLYQRFLGSDSLPAMLRPVFFLFIAAPSMASLAWDSISSSFDTSCKMLFFLSLFLFASLDVKGVMPNALMLILSVLSVLVTLALMVFTAFKTNDILPHEDPFTSSSIVRSTSM